MDPHIRLKNVYKGWQSGDRKVTVLKDATLDVFLGQSIAVVGPSGSGKSTLLHILGLLTPVDEGTIIYGNKSIKTSEDWWDQEIRNSTGIIFQDSKLIPNLSVLENVAIPLLHRGFWPKKQKELSQQALSRVGLEHRLDHNPNQLSGGEMVRVAIARALVLEPKILLADEPTGTLDSKNGDIIANMLYDLVSPSTALILVTHHLPLAERADRILEIQDGILSEQRRGEE